MYDLHQHQQNTAQNANLQQSSSINPQKNPQPVFSNISEQQLQNERLQARLDYYRRINSFSKSIEYEGNRYIKNFQDDLLTALTTKQNIPRQQTYGGYKVESYLQSTNYSLSVTQRSKNSILNSLTQSTIDSTYSRLKSKQKQKQNLQNILKDFNFNFFKHSFRHYYQLQTNLKIIFSQKFDQLKEFQPLLPANIHVNIDDETFDIPQGNIMFPPPYSPQDFVYVHDKFMFKLSDIKNVNIYRTNKSKNLIFLKIRIFDLITFFGQFLPDSFFRNLKQPFETSRNQIYQLFDTRNKSAKAFQLDLTYANYETQALLMQMAENMKQELQKQSIAFEKIQYDLKKFCEQKLDQFIEWVAFYNFTICCFEHFNKKPFPIKNYIEKSKRQLGYKELKIIFFKQTFANPQRLKRVFRQSIAQDKNAHFILPRLQKRQFNIENVYLEFHRIPQEEEAIVNLIKYETHYLQYTIEVINQFAQSSTISLQASYNCVRFLLIFLISSFVMKAIKRINRQINFCYGSFISKRIERKRQDCKKLQELQFKLTRLMRSSYEKIQSYIKNIGIDKNSTNVQKMQLFIKNDQSRKSRPAMMQLIKQVYASFEKQKNNKQKTSHEIQSKQSLDLFACIVKLLSTEYAQKRKVEKLFKKFTEKHLKTKDIQYQKFILNQPILKSQTRIQNDNQLKKRMADFQKDYKICIIQIIKICSMTTSIWCYSWAVEQKAYKLKNSTKEQKKIPNNSKQMLARLDLFYIHDASRFSSTILREPSTTISQINEILLKLKKFTQYLNKFFLQLQKVGDPKSRWVHQILQPDNESQKNCVVPVGVLACFDDPEQDKTHWIEDQGINYQHLSSMPYLNTADNKNDKKNWTGIVDLNNIVDRKIHKNKLSIFGAQSSFKFAAMICDEFNQEKSFMNQQSIQRNLEIAYNFIDSSGKMQNSSKFSTIKNTTSG